MNISPYIYLALYIVLFLQVLFGVMFTAQYFIKSHLIKKTAIDLYNNVQNSDKMQEQLIRKQKALYGKGNKKTLFSIIDEDLRYSGLRLKYPNLTPATAMVGVGQIATIMFIALMLITANIVVQVAIPMIFVVGIKAYLVVLKSIQYKAVESQLLSWMGVVENFSASSDDLITIFDRQLYYLEDPLKTAVQNAVFEARATGNTIVALENLEDAIEHKFFKSTLRNLTICSKFDANYAEIITSSRDLLQAQLKFEKERQSLYANGRNEIMAMVITGLIAITMTGTFTENSESTWMQLYHGGPFGIAILIFTVVSLLVCTYMAFIKQLTHD